MRVAEAADAAFADDTLPWFARGQAALALAVHGAMPSQSRFVDIYDRSPYATKPDLIAAVVLGRPRWSSSFLKGASTSAVLLAVSELELQERDQWLV